MRLPASSVLEVAKRVLVVDDHPAVALALKVSLRGDDRFEVAGSARTAAEGLRLLAGHDAVLLDLHLPDMSGPALVHAFRERDSGRGPDPALGGRRHARGGSGAPSRRRRRAKTGFIEVLGALERLTAG